MEAVVKGYERMREGQALGGINLFSHYCRRRFGQPVGKIALGLGRPCPNRRLGGCLYCAPASFTPYYLDSRQAIAEQLARGRAFLQARKFKRYFAYFQQETPTAGPLAEFRAAVRAATVEADCLGLIVSTRPDSLGQAVVDTLAELAHGPRPLEVLVELGLQSAHDRTLADLNRNHSVADFLAASQRVKAAGLLLGVHLILGLPGEEMADMLATVRLVAELGVDAVKFHHLQVIRGTALHRRYEAEPFPVLAPRDYLSLLAQLLARLKPDTVIHRLWSSSDPKILVQPVWGGLGAHELHTMLAAIMAEQQLWQGKYAV